jgi:hypothetical protein
MGIVKGKTHDSNWAVVLPCGTGEVHCGLSAANGWAWVYLHVRLKVTCGQHPVIRGHSRTAPLTLCHHSNTNLGDFELQKITKLEKSLYFKVPHSWGI